MNEVYISVVILSYNTRELLEKCLNSILENEKESNIEIIVVDNASADGSVDMVRKRFPQVVLIANEKNLGFASAVNQGLRISRGRFIVVLNSDTVLLNNAFTKMAEFMKENPGAGAVRPKVLNPDGSLQRQGSGIWRIFKAPDRVYELDWVSGCCMMLRREIIENVGFFDEFFFFYNEDLDYSKRIKKAGWKLYYFPPANIIHYWGKSSKGLEEKLLIEGYRGGYYLCEKYYGRPVLLFYKMLALLELIAKIIVCVFFLPWKRDIKNRIRTYFRIIKMTVVPSPR